MTTQQHASPAARPLTGEEYIESLRDGREMYIYGERSTTSRPTRPSASGADDRAAVRRAARPRQQDVLTAPTDTGNGGYTHPFFRTPRSAADLYADRDAIAAWARLTYGWMGRSPDYKAAFLGTLGANADYYAPFAENARRWYTESQEKVLYWNHAIINPPVDRDRPPDEVRDVFMHVEEETDDGLIVVRGAKVVATGSAITHYNFIAHYGLPIKKRGVRPGLHGADGPPGMKLICRQSYARPARRQPVRLPVVRRASTRTTRSSSWTR